MNILMMTNTFTPFVGGVARSVTAFAEECRKAGHRVVIVAPGFEGSAGIGRGRDSHSGDPALQWKRFLRGVADPRLPFPPLGAVPAGHRALPSSAPAGQYGGSHRQPIQPAAGLHSSHDVRALPSLCAGGSDPAAPVRHCPRQRVLQPVRSRDRAQPSVAAILRQRGVANAHQRHSHRRGRAAVWRGGMAGRFADPSDSPRRPLWPATWGAWPRRRTCAFLAQGDARLIIGEAN